MIQKVIQNYLQGLKKVLKTASPEKTKELMKSILSARRVFVFGAGRSGLIGKAFAMRLMHLGKEVFFIGETITPAIQPGDVIFFISGSGDTLSVTNMLKAAQKKQIKILGLTARKNGTLYKKGDEIICLDTENCLCSGDYLTMQILGSYRKVAPLGTSFESSALVYLDSLIVLLMAQLDKNEQDLKLRHANIE
ncbi:MAG: 6-phospho-3-hexuloisomerase [Patescibacteria group bacterium]